MTNGTGFIALAALIFGKWRPWTAFAGAILFGFTRALGPACSSSASRSATSRSRASSSRPCPTSSRSSSSPGRSAGPSHRPPTASPTSGPDDARSTGTRCATRPSTACAAPTSRTPTTRWARPAWWTTAACSPPATWRTRPTASRCAPSAASCRRSTRPAAGAWSPSRASTGAGQPLVPCGRCRQLLHEHGGPELLFNARPLAELLPDAFGPDHLRRTSCPCVAIRSDRPRDPTSPRSEAVVARRLRDPSYGGSTGQPVRGERHRPDPGEAGRRGALATSRSTGSSTRTPVARWSTSRPPPC